MGEVEFYAVVTSYVSTVSVKRAATFPVESTRNRIIFPSNPRDYPSPKVIKSRKLPVGAPTVIRADDPKASPVTATDVRAHGDC